MREAPSAYIFESDGSVHRQRTLDGDDELAGILEADSEEIPA